MSRLVKIVDNKYVQIEEYRNPNICFNTSEYDDFEDYCTLRETFDPFEMFYENQKLKKQLSNSHQIKTKQKEFIEWLEKEIKETETTIEMLCDTNSCRIPYLQNKNRLSKEILQKYKSIIGDSDEKEN